METTIDNKEITIDNKETTIDNKETTIDNKETTIDISTEQIESLDMILLNLYKHTVDYCRHNSLKDYETKKPLICYLNRDLFLEYIKTEINSA
jgi:hypothetical protein